MQFDKIWRNHVNSIHKKNIGAVFFIDKYYFYYVNCGCDELLTFMTIWEDA